MTQGDPLVTKPQESARDTVVLNRALEIAVRIGLVAVLVGLCFQIVRPFLYVVAWGMIIGVATYPAYRHLEAGLGERRGLAATLFTLIMLALLIAPILMLAGTLVEGAHQLASNLKAGTLSIPPPPERIASWPVVGAPLERLWSLASVNLEAALHELEPEIKPLGLRALSAAADTGLGIIQFVAAIVVAGVLHARASGSGQVAYAVANRLAGERGAQFADLAQATVRGVARGILGVALIQSLLAGLGFLAVGLPAAGLLAFLCFLLAVIQIGPTLILIPTVIYVFYTSNTVTWILFFAWCVFVALIDNVLKPLLLGRGAKVPILVIFVGAIGGFLDSGIIGLFVGSVVLALGYSLLVAWLEEEGEEAQRARA
ncbi:MAG TPA: AI-2E family transporter [Myxococcota bacterium]|nr:AI-2E family transporter [Myxococcota bacterium]